MIQTIAESANVSTKVFRTFEEGRPELIPTGLPAVDSAIGGLFAGTAGILGGGTGVGKSSLMLSACLSAAARVGVGIISLEDTPDVLGSRALATRANVNSLSIRTKNLTEADLGRLRLAQERLIRTNIHIAYCIGRPLDEIEQAVRDLAERGCKIIYLDYIQKIRGVSNDRRTEVGTALTRLQGVASEAGVALMLISQIARQMDPGRRLTISSLKESGDLENEARLIVLIQRDPHRHGVLNGWVAKSTFGGEGKEFSLFRDGDGILREIESRGVD